MAMEQNGAGVPIQGAGETEPPAHGGCGLSGCMVSLGACAELDGLRKEAGLHRVWLKT